MTDWTEFTERLAEQLAILPAGAIVKIVEAGVPQATSGSHSSRRPIASYWPNWWVMSSSIPPHGLTKRGTA
jgi:hypothetical protein